MHVYECDTGIILYMYNYCRDGKQSGHGIINPSARMRRRVTLCLSVCLSVTALAAAAFILMPKLRYEQL